MRYIYPAVAAIVAIFFLASTARAEGVAEVPRYTTIMLDGALHRVDLVTGSLHRLQKLPGGALQWVHVDVQEGKAKISSSSESPEAARDPRLPAPPHPVQDNASMGQPPQPRRRAPTIEIEDDQGNVITDTVSAEDRKAALPLIATYESKISLSHTVQIGDKITGNILIKNLGDRRIKALELTMQVPIIGRDKPEEHHFLFLDKPGNTTPPQPGSGGREPSALLQKVDIPCPSGGVRGSPELKITFIRFE